MTQSGVSQHIKKLEQLLDTPLLIREGKSFSLTDAGLKLHHQGKELLSKSEELSISIKHDEQYAGRLRLASPGSIGLKLYPHLLDIQRQHPQLIIDYAFAPNSQIEQSLIEREIEIGLVTEQTQSALLSCKKIAEEPLVLITAKSVTNVDWAILLELGFINHPDGAYHAQQLLCRNFTQFSHIDQFPHRVFSNQISLILEPVSRNLGFTVLPLNAANAFHRRDDIMIHSLPNTVSEPLYLCKNTKSFESKRSQYVQSIIAQFA